MLRRLLVPFALTLGLVVADMPAQAQQRGRSVPVRRTRTHSQPRSSDEVKLAPGMRLGRPLALTTDYMGRPLKPKPAKPARGTGATSMSAQKMPATSAATTAASAKTQASKPAAKRKRR